MRVGTVEGLWRYPVKSMRGEVLAAGFLGFAGLYGDRIYAITSTTSSKAFPYLTGRTQPALLQYQPRFRNVVLATEPATLVHAEQLHPRSNLTPLYPDPMQLELEVRTPLGEWLAIEDPALLSQLSAGMDPSCVLGLVKSQRALTDCRPVLFLSMQSMHQLQQEMGIPVDFRRFRANLYLDLAPAVGFAEDAWVGHTVRIGTQATVRVMERDARCKMITLDAETGESNPAFFKHVQREHEGKAGVYGAVLVEGRIRVGDSVELLD